MNSLLAALALTASAFTIPPAPSEWHTDYGLALQTAKETRRPLLIVLERPDRPEQRVEQASFTTDPEQLSLLTPYTLCRIDTTTPYGESVAQAFGATQFPHTAVIDNTASRVIFRKTGRFSPGDWATTLVTFRQGQRILAAPAAAAASVRSTICFT